MHYLYIKAPVAVSPPIFWRILPSLLFFGGFSLVAFSLLPIFYYQIFVAPDFRELVTPVSEKQKAVLGEEIQTTDMSQPANWFPQAKVLPPWPSKITTYNLTIPKLKIKEAVVEIGGKDLKKSLIHYSGTAFPGQPGNAVIFGHSSLPQFFSPTNYTTILSYLPTLKKRDLIFADFDGVSYQYRVEEISEVKPEDISVVEQRNDDSYLTLVTCVPPGTYLHRLVVFARLIPLL